MAEHCAFTLSDSVICNCRLGSDHELVLPDELEGEDQ